MLREFVRKLNHDRRIGFRLLRVIGMTALLYVALCVSVYFLQRRLQYFPGPSIDPRLVRAYPGLREVEVTTADALRLKAWYWPGTKPGTVLFFHGNADDRSNGVAFCRFLHDLGYGLLVPDYRGYGGNPGSPTEFGLSLDAMAAVEWLRREAPGPIVYYGMSLGGAVAIDLARRAPPAALVLQSTFDSAVHVAQNAYFFLPVDWLMKDRFDSTEHMPFLTMPKLFLHGARDKIIPLTLGRRLHDCAPEPREWHEFAEGGHFDLNGSGGEQFEQIVGDFVRRYLN